MNIGGKLFATFLPSLVTLGTVAWTSLAHLSSVQDPAQVADQQATIEALEKAEGHGTTYRDVASADEAAGSRTMHRIPSRPRWPCTASKKKATSRTSSPRRRRRK